MRKEKSRICHPEGMEFHTLQEEQCAELVRSALRVLENTGCKIKSKEARHLLEDAGCTVEGDLVKIPESLVQKSLQTVPSTLQLYDRDGHVTMSLEPYQTYYGTAIGNPMIVDSITGERRRTVRKDVVHVARVAEGLPNINWVCGMSSMEDCNPGLIDLYEAMELLKNTRKTIIPWAQNLEHCRDIIQMFSVVAGGMENLRKKPNLAFWLSPISPLTHPDEVVDPLLYLAGEGIPVIYTSGPTSGGGAPITFAGHMVIGLADCLAGLVISQVKREGAPFICGSLTEILNLGTMGMVFGHPSRIYTQAAAADIYRYLNIPFAVHFGSTDAFSFDQQAAGDIAVQIMFSELAHSGMNCFLGFLESGMSGSLDAIVYGNEMIQYAREVTYAREISEETLAEDVIQEVGPGGNYLAEEHTVEHMDVFWQSGCLPWLSYERWMNSGKPTLFTKVNEKVKELIATEPSPLPEDTLVQLENILSKAESRL